MAGLGSSASVATGGNTAKLSGSSPCHDRDARAAFAAETLAVLDELLDNPMTDIATVHALKVRLIEMSL